MESTNLQEARQRLMNDFNTIVTDTEALLKAVRDVPGEKVEALRASAEAKLAATKERLRAAQTQANTYVHENPWPLIGAAALAGFILGLMARGGGSDRDDY